MDLVSQNLLLTSGGKKDPTYVDDVFSTYLWAGTSGSLAIDNGIDLAGEGGLVWMKMRNANYSHGLYDTVRGTAKEIRSDTNAAENPEASGITAFNSNGFTTGSRHNQVTNCNAWTFRKQKGFFDIVTWSGNSTGGRQIAHNLGSVPGCIMIKNTNNTQNWQVYNRAIGAGSALFLDLDYAKQTGAQFFNNTEPTATHFTLGTDCMNNCTGYDYIAYVFAGGASDEPGSARSVEFDGSGDYLSSATSSDLSFGTGDYTVEFWFNANAINDTPLFENRVSGVSSDTTGFTLTAHGSTNGVRIWWNGASRINGGGSSLSLKQWHHLAATRSSGTTYLFLNGTLLGTTTDSLNITTTEAHIAGGKYSGNTGISHYFNGKISNVRIIKGTALYTSSFRPPTAGLTNITNTKLLCCNKNTVTGSTVTPGTITSNGNPQSVTDTPFDDPAGFVFGDSGTENIIKCGSYVGSGSSGLEVNVGFEPSWVMLKNTSVNNWYILDSMRGFIADANNDQFLCADLNQAESNYDFGELTSTGFKLSGSNAANNANGDTYVYICLRRPDGYVGKPAEAGTDTFAMDTWVSDSTPSSQPNMISNFPVDFVLDRDPTYNGSWQGNWHVRGRLIQNLYLQTQSTAAEGTGTWGQFDYSNGWMNRQGLTGYSNWQSWMFKRHAGFDVVTDKGNGQTFKQIPHGLSVVPEMIWRKNRDGGSDNWQVYHIGLNGGTNPHLWRIYLNTTNSNSNDQWTWDSAPTATHFTVGSNGAVNRNNEDFITMLFASVDGISKVGYYTGNGTTSGNQITLGFPPRFLILRSTAGSNWWVFDTVRGWNGSSDKIMYLDNTSSSANIGGFATPNSTGFNIITDGVGNNNAVNYIYYAHA